MSKYARLIGLCFILFLLPSFAAITHAQVYYTCDTVTEDPNEGVILEWDPVARTMPAGVGLGYVILKANEAVTFTATQVKGGPTPVIFQEPTGVTKKTGLPPTGYTFVAPQNGTYDFLVMVAQDSTGQVRINWSCGVVADGEIHDGRINSRDLGTLTVIYPQEKQIDIYAVNPETSEGYMVIRFPLDQLPPYDTPPTEPLLLGEATSPFTGKSIALYLLPSNEFVVASDNPDGSPYRFLWPRPQ